MFNNIFSKRFITSTVFGTIVLSTLSTPPVLGEGFVADSIDVALQDTPAINDNADNVPGHVSGMVGNVTRVAGRSRVETSVLSANIAYPNPKTVILVGSTSQADAFTAIPLASVFEAPVLLAPSENSGSIDKEIIKQYFSGHANIEKILIVGGQKAVSDNIINTLVLPNINNNVITDRISGSNRSKTSVMVADYITSKTGGNITPLLFGLDNNVWYSVGAQIPFLTDTSFNDGSNGVILYDNWASPSSETLGLLDGGNVAGIKSFSCTDYGSNVGTTDVLDDVMFGRGFDYSVIKADSCNLGAKNLYENHADNAMFSLSNSEMHPPVSLAVTTNSSSADLMSVASIISARKGYVQYVPNFDSNSTVDSLDDFFDSNFGFVDGRKHDVTVVGGEKAVSSATYNMFSSEVETDIIDNAVPLGKTAGNNSIMLDENGLFAGDSKIFGEGASYSPQKNYNPSASSNPCVFTPQTKFYEDTGTQDVLETQSGISSLYWQDYITANGEPFDKCAMTAAHRKLPLGSIIRVTRVSNGKSVVVRVNDRGPYKKGRVLDLALGAAQVLDFTKKEGLTKVKIEVLEYGKGKK